jgi:hypothetical protein
MACFLVDDRPLVAQRLAAIVNDPIVLRTRKAAEYYSWNVYAQKCIAQAGSAAEDDFDRSCPLRTISRLRHP